MKVITRLLLVLLIASVAVLAIAADPEPQAPITAPATGETQPAVGQEKPLSPMMSEIRATMEVGRGQIAELTSQAAATPDQVANQAIQNEIATVKQQVELDILGIQVRYARSNGDEDLALKIEASIAAITSPPAAVAPAEARPAPDNQN